MIFEVPGIPQPQGSTKPFQIRSGPRRGQIVTTSANPNLRSWRSDVALIARAARHGSPTLTGPISLTVIFYMLRPKGHYGTGRNEGVLRPSAPAHVTTKPDVDKLARSISDSLTTALVYRDDSQVVELHARKVWAVNFVGVMVSVRELFAQELAA